MLNSRMLYKYPGPYKIHGDKYDYIIVKESETLKYLAKGWTLTTGEAKKNKPDSDSVDIVAETETGKNSEDKKRKYKDFSEEEKSKIIKGKKSAKYLASKYNTTVYTINKIRRKPNKDELD